MDQRAVAVIRGSASHQNLLEPRRYPTKSEEKNKNSKQENNNISSVAATPLKRERSFLNLFSMKSKSPSSEDLKMNRINNGELLESTNNRHKSIFRRRNFCMNPEDMRMKINMKLSDSSESNEKGDMRFLGLSFLRQTSEEKVISLNNILTSMNHDVSKTPEKSQKLVAKYLRQVKQTICSEKLTTGGNGSPTTALVINKPEKEKDLVAITDVIIKCGFISTLIIKMPFLGFEERKLCPVIFSNMFRRKSSERPTLIYFQENPKLLFCLLDGYNSQSSALPCGQIIRECLRYESLAKIILHSDYFYEIFEFLKAATFEISSDAFVTLEMILTEHKTMTARYIENNYEKFFSHFHRLLSCDNYVTKITALRLMTTILLDRKFFDLMKRYVSDTSNLKRIMILMSCDQMNIQVDAYNVFKIFLANPTPCDRIKSIFVKNKERLIKFLKQIECEKYGEQFIEEKIFLINVLREMTYEGKGSRRGSKDGDQSSINSSEISSE